MSDNDRMDRAERIRQMREGQREDADDGSETDPSGTNDDTDETKAATSEGDAEAETTTEAVGNVSGTSASIPSTEEMEAAMERTMAQAETVASEESPDTDEKPSPESADSEEGAGETGVEETATEEPDGPAGITEETTTRGAQTRVLEFSLAGEQYCLDIEYIEEIVKHETITRVPNTPGFVEGVVDLRGQITTILNPKVTLDKDDQSAGELIVVFDADAFDDQGAIGWVVDDVRQVSPVHENQVNDPPLGEDYINGVIDRDGDDEFVIWTTPHLALEEAE